MFNQVMEKVATFLEKAATKIDHETSEKIASSRKDIEERLLPAIKKYEKVAKAKLSESEKEEIYSGGNDTLVKILEKLASTMENGAHEDFGAPERVFTRTSMPSSVDNTSQKVAEVHRDNLRTSRGRRRDSRELKRQTLHREHS